MGLYVFNVYGESRVCISFTLNDKNQIGFAIINELEEFGSLEVFTFRNFSGVIDNTF